MHKKKCCSLISFFVPGGERNLDDLIESLGASDTSDKQPSSEKAEPTARVSEEHSDIKHEAEGEEMKEVRPEEYDGDETVEECDREEEEEEGGWEHSELIPSLEASRETEEIGAEQLVSGLRRRNRPEWTWTVTLLQIFIL